MIKGLNKFIEKKNGLYRIIKKIIFDINLFTKCPILYNILYMYITQ